VAAKQRDQRSLGIWRGIGDFDNDGGRIFLSPTTARTGLSHKHDGTFTMLRKGRSYAGELVVGSAWETTTGWRLDLFVSGYVHFDRDNFRIRAAKLWATPTAVQGMSDLTCGPAAWWANRHLFQQWRRHLYRREREGGRGRREQVLRMTPCSSTSTVTVDPTCWCHDSTPNYFYRNKATDV